MANGKKKWFSVAVLFPHGLEIFRHQLTPHESAELWQYMERQRVSNYIGQFAIVADDNVNPLPDEAIAVSCKISIMELLKRLNIEAK